MSLWSSVTPTPSQFIKRANFPNFWFCASPLIYIITMLYFTRRYSTLHPRHSVPHSVMHILVPAHCLNAAVVLCSITQSHAFLCTAEANTHLDVSLKQTVNIF